MDYADIQNLSQMAVAKYEMSKKYLFTYFVKCILAGFFIVVGVVLSYTTGGMVYNVSPYIAPIFSGLTFSIALMLIYFVGGDLFTGNCLVMFIGMFDKKCTFMQTLRVWVISFIGNSIGVLFMITLFYLSKSYNDSFVNYIQYAVTPKLALTVPQFFIKGMLCNFAVSLAIIGYFKMKSEAAKIIFIMFCIFSFYMSGYEHCIANVAIFSIAFYVTDTVNLVQAAISMVFVTIGNIIGAGVLLGVPLYIMAAYKKK